VAEPASNLRDQAGGAAEDGIPGRIGKSRDEDLAILEGVDLIPTVY
jgi:hypothetical protein